MKAPVILISALGLMVAAGCISKPESVAKAPEFVNVSATVIRYDPSGMVLHMESFGGVGCGSVEDAALATVRVLAPKRYSGREYSIRLSPFRSNAPIEGTERLQQIGSEVNLEVKKVLLRNSAKQTFDLPSGEVRIIKQPNQPLQGTPGKVPFPATEPEARRP
jgi:hypothetical protein